MELDEAVKLGTKVVIHAPGKSYHGKSGTVGEIRHGLFKGAPKTYTIDYDRDESTGHSKSIQLDKKNVKVQKEEVELDESYVGRETKDGVWRVFKTGNPVAVAGPFKSSTEASAWTKSHNVSEETTMNPMEMYLSAIAGSADFASTLAEKTLTAAERKKREEVELDEAVHSPYRKAAIALRNMSLDPKKSDSDRAAYSTHADLLGSKNPEHHEASARIARHHDTHVGDEISNAVHRNSSKVNSAKYHKMAGWTRLREEAELDEEQLDELSKGTLARYAKAAPRSAADLDARAKEMSTVGHLAKKDGDAEQAGKFFSKAGGLAYKSAMRQRGHDKAIDRLTKEEVEQIDEMTQGKSYTQQQLMKKVQSGNWEATTDIKPGKHVEMRHHSGKRVMVHCKESADLDEAMISYSDFMDKIAMHRKAGNKVVDHKYTDKKATYTTVDSEGVGKKITHTETGAKQEHLGKIDGDDNEAEAKQQPEKRGRGRPAGTKSGARH